MVPGVVYFGVAGLCCVLLNWLALIEWRRSATAHWTERARQLWPARIAALAHLLTIPPLLVFTQSSSNWVVDLGGAFAGTLLGSYFFDREVSGIHFRKWLRHVAVTLGMYSSHWLHFAAACVLMPYNFGLPMVFLVSACLIWHFSIQFGLSLVWLRRIGWLRPAQARLQEIVNRAAASGAVEVRAVWELENLMANAFALTTRGALIFTSRLLEICEDDEVQAICAHELGHLRESKMVLAGRLAASLSVFPLLFAKPAYASFRLPGLVGVASAALVVAIIANQFRQRMEKKADAVAIHEDGASGVYARALEKLYRENRMPAVSANEAQTHPHLYDRLLAAGLTPDYPRPAKPRGMTFASQVAFIALVVVLLLSSDRIEGGFLAFMAW